ncbi:MAG: group II truncated hemoglobin [Myxococcota bacterium]
MDSPYEEIGGADAVRALCDRFYDAMDRLPHAAVVRAMHPDDLTPSRQKFYEFLSGWMGGPQLYVKSHGHPRLRMRHMPFAIDASAAEAWLGCMAVALEEVPDEALRERLWQSFCRVAQHMLNRE